MTAKKKRLPSRHQEEKLASDKALEEEMRADAGLGVARDDWDPYAFLRDYKNKPRWIDDEAVIALVNELRDDELEEERQFYERDALYGPHAVPVPNPAAFARFKALLAAAARRAPPPPTAEEREAMAAARCGQPERLASLVASGRCRAPAALQLAAELMTGVRDPRTGEPRRGRGRPRMSSAERRMRNPIHDAADEFEAVRGMLRALYPEQSSGDVRDLAETIATARTGAKASLANYRKRARKKHKLR